LIFLEMNRLNMSEETHPIVNLSDEALQQMLRRAMRNVLILGLIGAGALLIGSGWKNAAMLLTGALISAASVWEWKRLVQAINTRLDQKRTPASSIAVVVFFVLRLTVFAGVIYGSLRCFRGSAVALLVGLGLAVLAIGWEALQLMRD